MYILLYKIMHTANFLTTFLNKNNHFNGTNLEQNEKYDINFMI